jgi:hypothetical protein
LRFDYHMAPALERGMRFSVRSQVTGKPPADVGRHVGNPTMEHIDLESQSGIYCCSLALSSTHSSCWKFRDVPADAEITGVVVTPELHS